jgi:hypothetical protein
VIEQGHAQDWTPASGSSGTNDERGQSVVGTRIAGCGSRFRLPVDMSEMCYQRSSASITQDGPFVARV